MIRVVEVLYEVLCGNCMYTYIDTKNVNGTNSKLTKSETLIQINSRIKTIRKIIVLVATESWIISSSPFMSSSDKVTLLVYQYNIDGFT